MTTTLATLGHWVAANPYWTVALAWSLLSALNGLLPYHAMRHGSVLARLVGLALDRLSSLVRRDSPGTLSWPLVARSLAPLPVVQVLERPTVPDPLRPATPSKEQN